MEKALCPAGTEAGEGATLGGGMQGQGWVGAGQRVALGVGQMGEAPE